MIRIAFATALAALIIAPLTTTGTTETEPVLFVTNAPAGYVFPNDHIQECNDQLALVVTDDPGCEFEDEVRDGLGYIAIGWRSTNAGNTGPIPLTGTLTAHMTSESGREAIFKASWRNGQFSGGCICYNTEWPLYGEAYSYDCYSEFHPDVEYGAAPRGHWGECYVAHS